MKSNTKTLIVILFCFIIMSTSDMNSITFIIPFFCVILCISTFSYDEYNKWDAYAITLPKGRKNIVKSKYITTLILILISVIISFLTLLIIGYVKSDINIEGNLLAIMGSIIGVIVVMSFMYPCIYKFGVEKGRIFLLVGLILIMAIGGFIFNENILSATIMLNLTNFLNTYGLVVLPIVSIIILLISYYISLRIYSKKEF